MNAATKPWYRSATIWTNIALALAMIVPILSAQLGQIVGDDMALRIAAGAGLLNAVVQVIVRVFFTSTAISGSPKA